MQKSVWLLGVISIGVGIVFWANRSPDNLGPGLAEPSQSHQDSRSELSELHQARLDARRAGTRTPIDQSSIDLPNEPPPKGRIHIRLEGEVPEDSGVCVRASKYGKLVSYQPWNGDRNLAFSELPVGTYAVSLEHNEFFWGLVIPPVDGNVLAGEVTELVLLVRSSQPEELVPFSGYVIVPIEWGDREPPIEMRLEREFGPIPEYEDWCETHATNDPEMWAFDHDKMPMGTYAFRIREYTSTFHLGFGGDTNARIKVPGPATVIVRVVDEQTHLSLEKPKLEWTFVGPSWNSWGGVVEFMPWNSDEKQFRFRCLVGQVDLHPSSPNWEIEDRTVQIHPGHNTFTLEAKRETAILVQYYVDDKLFYSSGDKEWLCTPLSGEAESKTWSRRGETKIVVSRPGPYCITPPHIHGYKPVAPFTIAARQGKIIKHRLDYVLADGFKQ